MILREQKNGKPYCYKNLANRFVSEQTIKMFSDPFIKLEHGDAAAILDLLNPKLDISGFDTASAQVMSLPLPFYKDIDLIEVTDPHTVPPKKISALYHKQSKEILILNGKNEPIYDANKKYDLHLNDEMVALYARFFFSYVRGRHGGFHLIDSVNEIKWREEPNKSAKQSQGKMISPLSIIEVDEEEWHLISSVIFKDSLFESEIRIKKDGTVRMSNQEIIVEDIPVIDEAFD